MKQPGFILFFFLFFQPLFSQDSSYWEPPQKEELLHILDLAYNLEFEQFEVRAQQYRTTFPRRPEGFFIDVVAWWVKVSADLHNPANDDLYNDALDEIIDKLDEYDSSDPLYKIAQFYIDAATGFKAIMHVARKNWFSAALEGRAAMSGIKDALHGKIKNPDAKLGTGLYLYYADFLPQRYPLLKPLLVFYPSGDKKRGLSDLQETIDKGLFAKVMASYMKAIILYTREKDFRAAFTEMKRLVDTYPNNPTFIMWQVSLAITLRNYKMALELVDLYAERVANNTPFYPAHKIRIVNYRYGVIYYKLRQYDKAISFLNAALKPLEGELEESMERYKVYALLNKGYCLKSLKRKEDSVSVFKQVLQHTNFRNSHKIAQDFIDKAAGR